MNRTPAFAAPMEFRAKPLASVLAALWRGPGTWGVLAGALPALTVAGPAGEQVVAGDVTVARPDSNHTVIQQGSAKAILNWQQFSIGGDEYVQFNQPGTGAVALNRVVGGDVSRILGSLTANGQVFLVNPQGVYFGPGARVDVGGLVASIMDIRDEDFLAGRYVFSRDPGAPAGAGVVNEGYIRAREGGYVVLAGDYAGNTGVVQARLGQVVLASGRRMTLDVEGDGLVSFAVDEAVLTGLAGVQNSGELLADGGRVIMTAEVAGDLMASAVNNSGLVRARGVAERGGEIYLTAAGGDIVNGGTLDADGGSGGDGGTVLVQGDGDIDLPAGGAITARGDGAGSGGSVRVVADHNLAFRLDHTIDVRGGEPNRGGFVEVSGHGGLQLAGTLRLGGGQLVIDPEKILIVNGSAVPTGSTGSMGTASISKGWLADQLNGGTFSSGADIFLIASKSIEMQSGGVLDGRNPAVGYGGGDLHLIIGSPSDIGGAAGAGPYGVYSPGLFNLNSDPAAAAAIVLNDNVIVDGEFVAVTGQTAGGAGIGDIDIRDVTAGGNITVGSDGTGGGLMANTVKTGTLNSTGIDTVRVLAEDTVQVQGVSAPNALAFITTGNTAGTRSVTVTGGISAERVELGGSNLGLGTNARSVTVGGNINASDFSNARVVVSATDTIDLQDITLDGAEGGAVIVSGGTTATVTVGDITVNQTGTTFGTASINMDGAVVQAGVLAATAMGNSFVDAMIAAQADDLTVGGAEAVASNGYADVSLQGRSTPDTTVTVDGLTKAMSPKGTDLNIIAQGDVTIKGDVEQTFTGAGSDQLGGGLEIRSNDGTVTLAGGVMVAQDAGSDPSGARVNLRGGAGVVVNGTVKAVGTAPGGDQVIRVGLTKSGASATGSGLLDADMVVLSGGDGKQSNLSADLTIRTDNLVIGDGDDSDHWSSVAVDNRSKTGSEVQIRTNSTNTFDNLRIVTTDGDARHNEVFKSAGTFSLAVGHNGTNHSLNVFGNTYRVSTIILTAMGNIEAENVTITAPGGGIAQVAELHAGDELAGGAFDGVLNLGGASITATAQSLGAWGNNVLASASGGATINGVWSNVFSDNGDVILTDAAGYGAQITASQHLTMGARGSIRDAAGNSMIQADAVAMFAAQDIDLANTRIYVGDGTARDFDRVPLVPDAELVATLQQNAGQIFTDPEPASVELNAYFGAGNRLALGSVQPGQDPNGDVSGIDTPGDPSDDLLNPPGYLALQLGISTDIDGDSVQDQNNKPGYAWFEGKVIDLGPVVGEAANIIVQWATSNALEITDITAPDAATQLAAGKTYLTLPDHFSRFSATTHAPGYSQHALANAGITGFPTGPYSGDVNIPSPVNLGAANFFILSTGSTIGLENIQTSGLVGLINVLGLGGGTQDGASQDGASQAVEGELEELLDEMGDLNDPESPDQTTDGEQALARVCT